MLELKRTVNSLDDLPESVRGLYSQREEGEGFVLTEIMVEGLIPETKASGYRTKNDELLGEVKSLKERYRDIDPKRYRELAEQAEQAEREKLKLSGDFDSREKQLLERQAKAEERWREENTTLKASLQELLVDQAAKDALLGAQARKVGGINVLLPHLQRAVNVVEENGRHVVRVMGADGRPRMTNRSGDTSPMTISELVAEMKASDEFAHCFEAENRSGGGVSGSSGGGAPVYTRNQLRHPPTYEKAKAEAKARGGEILVSD